MTEHSSGAHVWREQALEATVIRACPYCSAPGVFSDREHVLTSWPACYVEPGDERVGNSVGSHCPQCNRSRDSRLKEVLGEIWRCLHI